MINWTQVLINFVFTVVASIISAVVTVRLSLKRFRSERWWEKKSETYSRIVEHLALLEFSLSKWMEEYESGPLHGRQEYLQHLHEIRQESTESVMQAATSGAYIISEEAAEVLKTLRKEMEDAKKFGADEDPYEGMKFELAAVRKYISILREYAKRDLGLR